MMLHERAVRILMEDRSAWPISIKKLSHALEHCDFYLDTSDLTPQEVKEAVLHFLDLIARILS